MSNHLQPVYVVAKSGVGVIDRWHSQYDTRDAAWRFSNGQSPLEMGARLDALGEDASADAIAAVIGNKSWTHPTCSGCNKPQDRVVQIGEFNDARLCIGCLDRMRVALGAAK